ncbi:hypothetical protein E1301_Tti013202 [Triplophysa tibetana]|uniref:Uncharacterized protein n=1 Tax=Triplophysa tibetana TaxID=1572043 RepID=A0A5A9NK10_9TELE|nr:hypothetical protein E1301_Tti013202 [Triplophysa tibetana]
MSPGRPLADCTLSFLHVSQAVVICRREFPVSRFTSPNAHKRSLAARCLIHYLRGNTDHLATSRVSLRSKSPLSHNPLGKIPIGAHIQAQFYSRKHAENGILFHLVNERARNTSGQQCEDTIEPGSAVLDVGDCVDTACGISSPSAQELPPAAARVNEQR